MRPVLGVEESSLTGWIFSMRFEMRLDSSRLERSSGGRNYRKLGNRRGLIERPVVKNVPTIASPSFRASFELPKNLNHSVSRFTGLKTDRGHIGILHTNLLKPERTLRPKLQKRTKKGSMQLAKH